MNSNELWSCCRLSNLRYFFSYWLFLYYDVFFWCTITNLPLLKVEVVHKHIFVISLVWDENQIYSETTHSKVCHDAFEIFLFSRNFKKFREIAYILKIVLFTSIHLHIAVLAESWKFFNFWKVQVDECILIQKFFWIKSLVIEIFLNECE